MGPVTKASSPGALWRWGQRGLSLMLGLRRDLIRTRLGRQSATGQGLAVEAPLRAELFSADQMEQHGLRLATADRLTPGRVPERLLARLAANQRVLIETCHLLTAAVTAKQRVTPAGEWLLDNAYLVAEQIRTARRHLPKGYSRELPSLVTGISAGLPRVYGIALETIAHGDGRVDPDSLRRFVASYQQVTPLRLGELWAIPIMLRLALIENLRRVAARVAGDRQGPGSGGRLGDQADADGPPGPEEPDLGDRGSSPLVPAHDPAVRLGAVAPLAGPGPGPGLPIDMDRAATSRVGSVHRAVGALRQPAASGRPGLGEQQHRQPAPAWHPGLERVRRDPEPGRTGPAHRPRRGLRRDGLCQPGQLPARRRDHC